MNIRNDQWFEDGADKSDEGAYSNCVQVAVHFNQVDGQFMWPLVEYNVVQIHPKDVQNHFKPAPSMVEQVGINGVEEKCLSTEWWEIIRSDGHSCFDHPGKGYMVHRMYQVGMDDNYPEYPFSVREQSFNFGWQNYNPESY